jgi:hypothetical protein
LIGLLIVVPVVTAVVIFSMEESEETQVEEYEDYGYIRRGLVAGFEKDTSDQVSMTWPEEVTANNQDAQVAKISSWTLEGK